MKRILILLFILLTCAMVAHAQTYEGGIQVKYTTNTRETTVPEVYGRVKFTFLNVKESGVFYDLYGSYSEDPDIADLHTRDGNALRRPTAALILRPTVGIQFNKGAFFSPHLRGGVDFERQFGLPSAPNQTLSPTFGAGVRIGKGTEVGVTRIFQNRLNWNKFPVQSVSGALTGRFNSNKLEGWRIDGERTLYKTGHAQIGFSAQYSHLKYTGCSDKACDAYPEYDDVGKVGLFVRFGKSY